MDSEGGSRGPSGTGAEPRGAGGGRLFRSRTDRKLAGVAGGLGAYTGVDPVVFRVGFVVLCLWDGIGLVLYALGWLLIPAAPADPAGEDPGPVVADRTRLALVLVAVAALLVSARFVGWGRPLLWVGLVVGAVVVLASSTRAPSAPAGSTQPPADGPPSGGDRSRVPDGQPSVLGWVTFGVVLVVLGLAVAADGLGWASLSVGGALALVLVVIGAALVVASRWGRAGHLEVWGVVVAVAALATSWVGGVHLEGGIGERTYRPRAVGELRPEYRLLAGELELDLRALELAGQTVRIGAGVTVGELVVRVPGGATLWVSGRLRAGEAQVLDRSWDGTGIDLATSSPGRDAHGTIHLEIDHGLGKVSVTRDSTVAVGEDP